MTTVKEAMEAKGLSTEGIKWGKDVSSEQQSHCWHDGHVCSFTHNGVLFGIVAEGEINFSLTGRPSGMPLIDWNDPREHLDMTHELGGYIDTDDELTQATNLEHPDYELIFHTCNQYECLVIHNELYVKTVELESERLMDAIEEVRGQMAELSANVLANASSN